MSGAASGIGAAIARRLGQDGPVVALDRDPAVQELEAALPLVADVTEPGAAEAAVAAAVSSFGGLDVLVPAAGVALRHRAVEVDDEEWEHVLAVNLTHVFRFCRAALPALRSGGSGERVIITIVHRKATLADTLDVYALRIYFLLHERFEDREYFRCAG